MSGNLSGSSGIPGGEGTPYPLSGAMTNDYRSVSPSGRYTTIPEAVRSSASPARVESLVAGTTGESTIPRFDLDAFNRGDRLDQRNLVKGYLASEASGQTAKAWEMLNKHAWQDKEDFNVEGWLLTCEEVLDMFEIPPANWVRTVLSANMAQPGFLGHLPELAQALYRDWTETEMNTWRSFRRVFEKVGFLFAQRLRDYEAIHNFNQKKGSWYERWQGARKLADKYLYPNDEVSQYTMWRLLPEDVQARVRAVLDDIRERTKFMSFVATELQLYDMRHESKREATRSEGKSKGATGPMNDKPKGDKKPFYAHGKNKEQGLTPNAPTGTTDQSFL